MTVTVTAKNYSLINACENSTQWTGETPGDVSDFYKEGTQCVGFTVRGIGSNDIYITGSWDLSGMKHLRCWLMTVALKELDTDANGGIQFYVSDGTNTGYYYVSGSTTYPGGWYNLVVDLSRAVDAGTKPTMTAITTIGLRFVHTANAKNAQNTWIDHLYVGDGLIAYGDDAGGSFDFADILSADENTSNGWGIIRKISGVYYLVGSLTFGDNASTNSCDFKDLSQIIMFEDRKVNSNLYNVTVVGNATGTTKFQLGNVSGGKGIQGCVLKSEGTIKYDVVCTDTNVSDFKLYGSTFIDADTTSLPASGVSREVISCSFDACGKVTTDTCKVQYCNFISADDDAITISSTTLNVTDCNFINPTSHGVEVTATGTYAFNNLQFSGTGASGPYDVENTTAGLVTIQNTNDSNTAYYENTGGGTTDIQSAVTLKVTIKDPSGNAIVGARVLMEAGDGTGSAPFEESVTITRVDTTATVTHTAHGLSTGQMVNIRGANQPEYNGAGKVITKIGADSYSYQVSGTPATPATGTITSTQCFMSELTITGGIAEESFNAAGTQTYRGRIAKSSASPYWRDVTFSGADCSGGLDIPIQMELDE